MCSGSLRDGCEVVSAFMRYILDKQRIIAAIRRFAPGTKFPNRTWRRGQGYNSSETGDREAAPGGWGVSALYRQA